MTASSASPPPGPSVGELLNAYAFGAFPMDDPADAGGPVPFYESDPRAVIPIDRFRVPRSVARGVARTGYDIRIDTAVRPVLEACADRPDGTWLSPRLIASYRDLHAAGFAHTIEAWDDTGLVGGLFGVALGGLFTSESMFHAASDAGNAVLVATARHLVVRRFVLWDIQTATEHTMRFGTELIPRAEYRERLHEAIRLVRDFSATARS
jgi:leucyl/phenylalanyl-tRNA--protein transferase